MMQAMLSSVMAIFFYALVITAVWKLFQIATDLGEIKALLSNTRKDTAAPAPVVAQAGPISLESAEALLREVAAESELTESGSLRQKS